MNLSSIFNRYTRLPITLVVLSLSVGIYKYLSTPVDHMIIYGVSKKSNSLLQSIANYRLNSLTTCPKQDFGPSNALTFMVSALEAPETNANQAHHRLKHLLQIGCDINKTDNTGLAPIHTAILFGNANTIALLIGLGAELATVITGDNKYADKTSRQFAEILCVKNPKICMSTYLQ